MMRKDLNINNYYAQQASIDNVAAWAVTRSLAVPSSTPNHRFDSV